MKEIITAINILNKYGTPKKIFQYYIVIALSNTNQRYKFISNSIFKKKLNLNVGFSDHTLGIDAALASVVWEQKL